MFIKNNDYVFKEIKASMKLDNSTFENLQKVCASESSQECSSKFTTLNDTVAEKLLTAQCALTLFTELKVRLENLEQKADQLLVETLDATKTVSTVNYF